ncbi:MAG TPA: ABC transporter ATP-binding protein [Gemmatimonadales bacterium]|nr:ABC transporter ATP-binding protein [Gemmatimonadales bacterium]
MLKIKDLHKSFVRAAPSGSKEGVTLQILRDVDLEVAEGQFVSLIGPSGCGKTTLIRSIAKLVSPERGTVSIDDKTSYAPGKDVCLVFQDSGLLPWYTSYENIEYGLKLRGVPRQERVERVRHFLELMGLEGFEESYPHQLSGGMRQRIGLARALACEPRVLLLDEPFAAVDAQTRERLQEELLRLWNLNRMTALFVTHSIDEAAFLSDRVIVLRTLNAPGTDPNAPSISADRSIELARPRDRYSEDYRLAISALRTDLTAASTPGGTSRSSSVRPPGPEEKDDVEVSRHG